jgi:hypothetical protein
MKMTMTMMMMMASSRAVSTDAHCAYTALIVQREIL